MRLTDVFLLYPALALLLIGLHQIVLRSISSGVASGFAQSYWILMLALLLLFTYQWRKSRRPAPPPANRQPPARSQPARKRKKK